MNTSAPISVYLASKSPRRQELLSQIGIDFSLVDVSVEEFPEPDELAQDYVKRLAREKSLAGVAACDGAAPVLGSDTIVVLDGNIMEKPQDKKHAIAMLTSLSNSTHQVMTAIALSDSEQTACELVVTNVTFGEISEQQAIAYWYTGEPADKAGGYAIQGMAGKFVKSIEGSYSSVVGLPLFETAQLIHNYSHRK